MSETASELDSLVDYTNDRFIDPFEDLMNTLGDSFVMDILLQPHLTKPLKMIQNYLAYLEIMKVASKMGLVDAPDFARSEERTRWVVAFANAMDVDLSSVGPERIREVALEMISQ